MAIDYYPWYDMAICLRLSTIPIRDPDCDDWSEAKNNLLLHNQRDPCPIAKPSRGNGWIYYMTHLHLMRCSWQWSLSGWWLIHLSCHWVKKLIIKGQLLNDCHQYLLALLHFFFLTIAICSFLVLLWNISVVFCNSGTSQAYYPEFQRHAVPVNHCNVQTDTFPSPRW